MSDPQLDLYFAELRSLVHDHEPGPDTRLQLGKLLRKAYTLDKDHYKAQWLPYLEGFKTWWSTPLYAVSAHYELERYKSLLPAIQPVPWMYAPDGEGTTYTSHREGLNIFEHVQEDEWAQCHGMSFSSWSFSVSSNGAQWHTKYPGGDGIIDLLLKHQHLLPALQRLEIVGNVVGYRWNEDGDAQISFSTKARSISPLCESDLFSQLRSLHFTHELSLDEVCEIAHTSAWPQMHHINLSNNNLPKSIVSRIFSEPMLELTHLNLSHNKRLDSSTVADLLKHPYFPTLESLDLSDCNVSASDIEPLLNHPHLPSLHTVHTGSP